jgi:hypothetical protein
VARPPQLNHKRRGVLRAAIDLVGLVRLPTFTATAKMSVDRGNLFLAIFAAIGIVIAQAMLVAPVDAQNVFTAGRQMTPMLWALLVSTAALFMAMYFVRKQRKDTIVAFATCPRCGARLPPPNPAGDGWTCEKCACEVDAQGRARS